MPWPHGCLGHGVTHRGARPFLDGERHLPNPMAAMAFGLSGRRKGVGVYPSTASTSTLCIETRMIVG